jgi:hypothetical protein
VARENAPTSREDCEPGIAEAFEVEDPTDTANGHEEDREHTARRVRGLLPEGPPNRREEGERARKEELCPGESRRP